MKFLIGPMLPTLPATLEDRARLRPIAHHTERWQQMFKEILELARMADDLGFEAITCAEHHLCTEGLEVGSVPSLFLYIAMNTKNIKVGPVGYVLPGWNPLRLAVEIGWLDQLTQGRTIVGMARGYQTRWLNQMGQKLHIQGTMSDQGEIDKANRHAFEEHFRILKLAWGEEGFTFKGDFWEYPYPYEEGTPWPAAPWTEKYGMPGRNPGRARAQNLGGAEALSEAASQAVSGLFGQRFNYHMVRARGCGAGHHDPAVSAEVRRLAELYQKEAASVGRVLPLGESIAPAKSIYIGRDTADALRLPKPAPPGSGITTSAGTSVSGRRSACPGTRRSGRVARRCCRRKNGPWIACIRPTAFTPATSPT